MQSSLITFSFLVTVVSMYTVSVHCRLRQRSVERIASDYIVNKLLPTHSILAEQLLNVLVKSVEENYEKDQREKQLQFNNDDDDVNDVVVDDGVDSQSVFDSDEEEDISDRSSSSSSNSRRSSINSLEGIIQRASRQQQPRRVQQQKQQQFAFGNRMRRFHTRKRGLGQCIHNCINGSGGMNFIQCKNMCH